VELEPEIEGLIHISELSTERVEKIEDVAKPGDTLRAEVISIDRDARKIGLSAKQVVVKGDRAELQKYGSAKGSSKTSLGDLFADQLKTVKSDDN
jgi:small subunit ribosomal protein S1